MDPFAGGGSIPLEALRLGCDAFASDLNPVACLILKVMLEDIPRHGPKLAEELRRVGAEIKGRRRRSSPSSIRTTRTARRPSPTFGRGPCAASRRTAARRSRSRVRSGSARRRTASGRSSRVVRPAGEPPRVEFEVVRAEGGEGRAGRHRDARKATCVACGAVLRPSACGAARGAAWRSRRSVRRARPAHRRGAAARRGDAPARRARAALSAAHRARLRGSPEGSGAARGDPRRWERGGRQGLCPVPDEPLPPSARVGVPRAAVRHAPVGRPLHGAPEVCAVGPFDDCGAQACARCEDCIRDAAGDHSGQ